MKQYILFILLVGGIVGCRHEKNGWVVKGQDGNYYRLEKAAPHESYVLKLIDPSQIKFMRDAPTLQDVLDESNTLIPNDSGYWVEKYKGHTKIKVVWDSLTKRWEEVMIFENGEYPLSPQY